MAQFNEILVGRFNRYFQKSLSMKGQAPAPQLSTEIQPSLVLPAGVEDRFLQGWNIGYIQSACLVAVAVNGGFRLRNPVGSNVIGVLERLYVWAPAATEIQAYNATTPGADLATVISAAPLLDIRNTAQQSALRVSVTDGVTSDAGAGGLWYRPEPLNNTGKELIPFGECEIPIAPGGHVGVRAVTANVVLTFSMRWRERHLEESERF